MTSAQAIFALLDDRGNRRPSRTSYLRVCKALRRLFPDDPYTQTAVLQYLEYFGPEDRGLYPRYFDKDGNP